jgi:mannosyltransferase OCH1-like enzyme
LVNFSNFIERTNKNLTIINNVPLNIYQSWHSHKIPVNMSHTIKKLLNMNPEFNYYLYSDDDCRNFISEYFNDDVVNAFNILKPGAYKSDLWRYCILYIKGGVYLDIKFYSTIPIISLIEKDSTIFVKDRHFGIDLLTCNESVYNAFMVSPPNNIIFKHCIDTIVENCNARLYRRNPLDVTGPCLIGSIILKYFPDNYNDFVKNYYLNGDNIMKDDTIIFSQYVSYRNDQKKSDKVQHYSYAWTIRNIYNY